MSYFCFIKSIYKELFASVNVRTLWILLEELQCVTVFLFHNEILLVCCWIFCKDVHHLHLRPTPNYYNLLSFHWLYDDQQVLHLYNPSALTTA